MTTKPTDDRRIHRTKKALRHALIALMTEKGYEQTSVQELIDRADVGRSTFYAHYADKDALLRENIAELGIFVRSKTLEATATAMEHPALAFSRPMLEHLAEVREMFAGQVGTRRDRTVQDYMHEMLCEIVAEQLPKSPAPNAAPSEVVAEFVVASFFAVTAWWALKAPRHNTDEVHRIFVALVSPSLEKAAPLEASHRRGSL